ncbi:NlpC/P60 family protein [Kineococcus gynurae]|uniref:NlpC/P60 family protein n=1 Tax=Kineococcus gynurae TaxID=452979 RepID=A0ABV5LR36_9ACTN
MSPVAEIQSRIAEIRSRIASLDPGTARAGLPVLNAGTPSASGSGTAFASALSDANVSRTTRAVNAGFGSAGTGEALLSAAKKYLGVPYRWGGTTPSGLDCSGLIQLAGKDIGVNLPRTAAQQATVGTAVPSLAQAKPGDLVVLENGHHIGIYVGNGQMLHAPKTGDVVKISKVWETPMTIRRLGTTAATTAAGAALATAAVLGTGAATASSTDYVRPPALSTSRSAPYDSAFSTAEQKYGLPAGLLSAVAKQESGYDPKAVSPAGARGLMQFMPATARGMGIDPMDPMQAIDGAGRLLRSHLDRFGSVDLALAAYNAGAGNVAKYGGVPPFKETQNYVRKITATLGAAA